MSDEDLARLRRWHERAYEGLRQREPMELDYFGAHLVVPTEVFAPTPMSGLYRLSRAGGS